MSVQITDVTQQQVDSDKERVIKKEWTETKSEEFMVQEKLNELSRIDNSLNQQVEKRNNIVAELNTAKSELGLNITMPNQKEVNDKSA